MYDYSYIRLGEPWDCLKSVNIRLERLSHYTYLSIKLHQKMSSAVVILELNSVSSAQEAASNTTMPPVQKIQSSTPSLTTSTTHLLV